MNSRLMPTPAGGALTDDPLLTSSPGSGQRTFVLGGFAATVISGSVQTTVLVSGELDLHTCSSFTAALEHARQQRAGGIVVELAHLSFLDSAGISALVAALRRVGGDPQHFRVRDASGQPRRVLEVTGLLTRLEGSASQAHSPDRPVTAGGERANATTPSSPSRS